MTHTELLTIIAEHLPGAEDGRIEFGSPPAVTITIHEHPDPVMQIFAGMVALAAAGAAISGMDAVAELAGGAPNEDNARAKVQIEAAARAIVERFGEVAP